MRSRSVTCFWMLLLFFPLAGCGGSSQYQLAPVSGTVTMDDKPLANVRVTFEPAAPEKGDDGEFFGPTSQAKTDSEGWYSLMVPTTEQDGAVVGQHVVRIYPVDDDEGKDSDELVDKQSIFIPARYNDESQLRATVPEAGTSAADFQLTSEPDEAEYE